MKRPLSELGAPARCISCGCTEDQACTVIMNGEPTGCAWVLLDREKAQGLCSACATVEQLCYAVLQPADPLELAPLSGQPASSAELSLILGYPVAHIRRALRHLEHVGLAVADRFDGRTRAWYRASTNPGTRVTPAAAAFSPT